MFVCFKYSEPLQCVLESSALWELRHNFEYNWLWQYMATIATYLPYRHDSGIDLLMLLSARKQKKGISQNVELFLELGVFNCLTLIIH